jgi:hypothetical protein
MYKICHQLQSTGMWRVTDAPDDWLDDGREYPETQASDVYFDNEADARAFCDKHNYPPSDETA